MTFHDYLLLCWRKKTVLLRTVFAFVLAAFLFLWMTTPEYTVSLVVGPTSANGAAALGVRVPNEIDSAPAMAEQIQSERLSDYARYLQLLTSRDVAARLIDTTPGLMQSLFPSDWDSKKQRWRFSWHAGAMLKEAAAFLMRRPGWRAPDEEKLAQYLSHHVVMTPIAGSPMRRLSLRHPDRGLAVNIVLGLHRAADDILRLEAARRADAIVDYVTRQMNSVSIAEHRAALTRLMAEQERARILMAVDLPYAADLITPPAAPPAPDWPNPSLVLGLSVLFGIMAGCILVTVNEEIRRRRKPVLRLLKAS